MGDCRMLSRSVCESDSFLSMPPSTQAFFLHLVLASDDCGFVSSPLRVARMCNACTDDLTQLAARGLVLMFDSGCLAIADFFSMNSFGRGRLSLTPHLDELGMLHVKPNGKFTFEDEGVTSLEKVRDRVRSSEREQEKLRLWEQDLFGKGNCRPALSAICQQVLPPDCADSLPADCSLIKPTKPTNLTNQTKEKERRPPTLEEVREYARSRNSTVDPERFFDYFTAGGWKDSRGKAVKSWKQKFITWERYGGGNGKTQGGGSVDWASEYDV